MKRTKKKSVKIYNDNFLNLCKQLFEYLDKQFETNKCNHKDPHKMTNDFLKIKNIENKDEVIEILKNHGGFCDCEVMFNSMPSLTDQSLFDFEN